MRPAKGLTGAEIAEMPHGDFVIANEDEFARLRDILNAFYIYD